jgi:hypothetical protein
MVGPVRNPERLRSQQPIAQLVEKFPSRTATLRGVSRALDVCRP